MFDAIFSWTVVGIAFAILIGAGFSVLSMTPPRHRIAEVCFCIAAAIFVSKFLYWSVRSGAGLGERLLVTFLIVGVCGALLAWGLVWIEGMIPKQNMQSSPLLISGTELNAINLSQSLEARKSEWWFWVTYRSGYGDTASPIAVAKHLEITNLTATPQTIRSYVVAIKTQDCGWVYLSPIDIRMTQVFWTYDGLETAHLMDFTSNGLNYILANEIPPYKTVEGWWFFDSKVKCDVLQGERVQFRISLTTYSGITYEYQTEPSLVENRRINPGSSEGGTKDITLRFTGKRMDISKFYRKLYSAPVQ